MAGEERPEAGWYPEPTNSAKERLWDGERWLDWVRPNRPERVELDPAGWRPDPSRPDHERLWSGESWTAVTRSAPGIAPTTTPPPVGRTETPTGAIYHDPRAPQRLGNLGVFVQLGLLLLIGTLLAEIVTRQIYLGYENRVIDGDIPGLRAVQNSIDALHAAQLANFGLLAIAAILFIVWFHRAYRNLIRRGIADVRYGPGWAIGSWFIPIFSWIRPKAIANDIWKGSRAAAAGEIPGWRELAYPIYLNWWWGLWIAAGLIGLAGSGTIGDANSGTVSIDKLRHERTGIWIAQVASVVFIVAAGLAIRYVRDISRIQDEEAVPGSALSSE